MCVHVCLGMTVHTCLYSYIYHSNNNQLRVELKQQFSEPLFGKESCFIKDVSRCFQYWSQSMYCMASRLPVSRVGREGWIEQTCGRKSYGKMGISRVVGVVCKVGQERVWEIEQESTESSEVRMSGSSEGAWQKLVGWLDDKGRGKGEPRACGSQFSHKTRSQQVVG